MWIWNKSNLFEKEGNKLFASGNYNEALECYTRALRLVPAKDPESVSFTKNRAAAYLKLKEYEKALKDANVSVELAPTDVKALFRRCQAHENLEKYDEAFKDARMIHHLEPHNNAIQPVLRRLGMKIQEIAKEQSRTVNKVKNMFNILLDENMSSENRAQATNNLIVLARERAGAELIVKEDGIQKLLKVMKQKNPEINLACVRIFSELCRKENKVLTVLEQVGLPFIMENMNSQSQQYVNAVQFWIQVIINTLSGMDIKEGKKPDKKLMKDNECKIDSVMMTLVKLSASRVMSAVGRDAILELITKNADMDALNWGMKLVDSKGLWSLLEIASELPEMKYESCMDITSDTRAHVAVALERVYWCMDHDKAREKYRDQVMDFIKERLSGPDIESKVRATAVLTSLLQGPLDVGNHCIGQKGIVEMMLVMAGTDDLLQQKVAAEAIIAAASKKDKCTSIVSMGTGILKKLYQSKNDNIKIRALVGLCKLGSLGGTDASLRPFAEGSSLKLATCCRKFLINPAKDRDIRKWAAEGLSYLTLDADVKEDLIDDAPAIRALIELAQTGDLSVLYGVVTTFVNLTNSYDKQEILPELVELAKFAKQHVPEDHPLDAREHVERRIRVLAQSGVTAALVSLSKTESKSSREMISRVFNAICEFKELRGLVVQQGGTKALLSLALEGTQTGKKEAAQALARIGITINPQVAFPGQRCLEVVRPLRDLLNPECSGLQNFEALLALTNLAQADEDVRSQIVKDHGMSEIDQYMYETHEELKRAAVQCTANIITHPEVCRQYEFPNDRVKYLVLLCEDDDLDTAKAAAGALAMLTSVSKKSCKRVFDTDSWHQIACKLVASQDKELVHRGVVLVGNLISASRQTAERVIETNLLELLMALTQPVVDDVEPQVKKLAEEALKRAEEWKLIKPNLGEEEAESD
ncbi:LOW QUALITY PROTEIN: protein unc-45 homolog B-like [Centruroides vittatus]|uniref:LOW QUALITY PROTEIN: protein unc-45 homolog B-like n=1 Tax=Centruroides vittatus TaxID=120091 RepID=UPI00350FD4CD